MFQLIVFDLDGTLIDSRRDLANATNALLVECGAAALSEEAIGSMVGDGAATLVARAFAVADIDPPADALDRFLRIYGDHLLDTTRPYPGIREAVGTVGAPWLVRARDPQDLAERILIAAASPEQRAELGRAGQERVRTQFSVAAMTAGMTRIVLEEWQRRGSTACLPSGERRMPA